MANWMLGNNRNWTFINIDIFSLSWLEKSSRLILNLFITVCVKGAMYSGIWQPEFHRNMQHTFFRTEITSNLLWRPEKARKCSAAQGPHSEVVPRAFWRLVSISCDECKGSFARGCEAKRWSHWTCSSLETIFQPMRINSVPDFKWFFNNKNVLCPQ